MNRWWLCGFIPFVLTFVLPVARGAEPAVTPHWIWDETAREPDQTLLLRKEFVVAQTVRFAELWVAADFHRHQVFLNGQLRLECDDYALPVRQNVTAWLKPGKNVLAIEARSSAAPAAVAVWLRIESDDGTREQLVSDASWSVSRTPQADWSLAEFHPKAAWDQAASFGPVEWAMQPDPMVDTAISPLDNYEQWEEALDADQGTDPP